MNDEILEIMNSSVLPQLKSYFDKFRSEKDWILISDYTQSKNLDRVETFCFSLVPKSFLGYKQIQAINFLQPKDLKNTSNISLDFISFISGEIFRHFVFCFGSKKENPFSNSSQEDARQSVLEFKNYISNLNFPSITDKETVLQKLKILEEKSKQKNFNNVLYEKIIVTSCIAAIIANWISKFTFADKFTWISDRDDKTTFCNGIIYEIFSSSYSGLAYGSEKVKLLILETLETAESGKLWFDEFIRIPDYIAGTFSKVPIDGGQLDYSKHQIILPEILGVCKIVKIVRNNEELRVSHEKFDLNLTKSST